MTIKLPCLAILAAGLLLAGCETTAPSAASSPVSAPAMGADVSTSYVFGWGNQPTNLADPRGGTSRGAPATLAPARALPLPGVSAAANKFDQDRAAILAMAGDYKVSFHFMESVRLTPDFKVGPPYHSWATERVHVLVDHGDSISLQHTLVMFLLQDDGSMSEPILMKHWRQDWAYEDTDLHTYRGDNTWARQTLEPAAVQGAWTQSVWQVDDSPRYATYGKWDHSGNQSVWSSADFWRPLPRREYSVRADYKIMAGTHRIRITPTGWFHEQRSLKQVETEADANPPTYLAEEIGLNRYERITSPALTAADEYWAKTSRYWASVREAWQDVYAEHDRFSLRSKVNGQRLYEVHFAYAGKLESEDILMVEDDVLHAHETVHLFLDPNANATASDY